jgi:hypothetical protein
MGTSPSPVPIPNTDRRKVYQMSENLNRKSINRKSALRRNKRRLLLEEALAKATQATQETNAAQRNDLLIEAIGL